MAFYDFVLAKTFRRLDACQRLAGDRKWKNRERDTGHGTRDTPETGVTNRH